MREKERFACAKILAKRQLKAIFEPIKQPPLSDPHQELLRLLGILTSFQISIGLPFTR